MRLIGTLPTESEANHLTAWLLTQSIECHVDRDGESQFEIWVKDEDGFETAKREIAEFQKDPTAGKYRAALAEARKIQEAKLSKTKQYQKNVRKGPTQQRGFIESAPLTTVLILISVVVAVLTNFGSEEKEDGAIARALQFVAVESPSEELQLERRTNPDSMTVRLASISRGEFWRTISPIFYHYSPAHIVFNMLWLAYLGRMIEARYGTLTLAMIVVFSAIFSNVLQCVVPVSVGGSVPFEINNLLISKFGGMSGVNYALFGFIWFRMLYDPNSRMYLSPFTVFMMLGFLFYFMVSPRLGGIMGEGSVANWAHGGGIVMGLLLGLSPIGKRFGKKKK